MCGRYFLSLSPEKLKQFFRTENVIDYIPPDPALPLQFAPLVVRRQNGDARMGLGRWGFLPTRTADDDRKLCADLKNARSETVHEKPTFQSSWVAGHRCLVPANGFNEWKTDGKRKTGYRVYSNEHSVFSMAGLWIKRGELVTFTVLTKEASPALHDIHQRMPVMFSPDQGLAWLSADEAQARGMIMHQALSENFRLEAMAQETRALSAQVGFDFGT